MAFVYENVFLLSLFFSIDTCLRLNASKLKSQFAPSKYSVYDSTSYTNILHMIVFFIIYVWKIEISPALQLQLQRHDQQFAHTSSTIVTPPTSTPIRRCGWLYTTVSVRNLCHTHKPLLCMYADLLLKTCSSRGDCCTNILPQQR